MEIKKLMMIVDNIKINRKMLQLLFEKDFDIIEAVNGQEAIALLEEGRIPDVILLDIVMPIMDGMEVLSYLRCHIEFSKIPVIIETGYGNTSQEQEVRALELGAADFIRKPYHPDVIRYRVSNVLDKVYSEKSQVDYDKLTKIYHKAAFYKETEQLLKGHPETEFAIILLDIERFKVVNDLFGTETGDKILTRIAGCLTDYVRGKGICGRLQGDNFVVCLPADQLDMESLISENDRYVKKYDLKYQLIISYGIYYIDERLLPIHIMCDRAKLAQQTVKGNYLKRYAVYDSDLRRNLLDEQEIVNEMDEALLKRQFCIYLQPIYSTITGKAVTAEALVRWMHPKKGLIAPDRFLPLFERNGFISRLDYFVREEACKVLNYMKNYKQQVIPISVNLSRIDFYNQDLCQDILNLIQKYSLDVSMIKIEITETSYTENPTQLIRTLEVMRKHGLEIYMDDFGSGYSSLNMLKDVPVDILKVDMKFLDGIETSRKAGSILRSIYKMAQALDMIVIAEGVETKGQLDILGEIGCERVQGYYYSKPLPVEEFLKLML